MGRFANRSSTHAAAIAGTVLVLLLNGFLVRETFAVAVPVPGLAAAG